MPSIRCSWCADTPFLLAAIRWVASNHLCSGICDRSRTVPVRTVNLSRQPLHMNMPAVARASSVKIGFVRSQVMVSTNKEKVIDGHRPYGAISVECYLDGTAQAQRQLGLPVNGPTLMAELHALCPGLPQTKLREIARPFLGGRSPRSRRKRKSRAC